jgi:hypothetical protein
MKTPRWFTRTRFLSHLRIAIAGTLIAGGIVTAIATVVFNPDTLVNVGSPVTPFSQNKQNEPALAVDAKHPWVLVAGSNDNIDEEACNAGDDTTCPFTPGVGVSGVYFSFNGGGTWIQPTYTGLSARSCVGVVGPDPGCIPQFGPIGTLPWYFENGLASDGDPAIAFGPKPDVNGHFSWANGSRLYYANLTANLNTVVNEQTFKGMEAIYVSRIDGPATTGLTPAIVANKNNWKQPVLISKQNGSLFSDKDQIWADNAASSPFFGNVYISNTAFRSLSNNLPSAPIMVAVSRDGGDTWKQTQVTTATSNAQHGFKNGTTIRTDSHGVVYLFYTNFAFAAPGIAGIGAHMMVKSFDGGHSWTKPTQIFSMNDGCYNTDPVQGGSCVEDGVAGARSDLSAMPSVDIANGAPSGLDATNLIVDTWADGRGSTGVQSNGFNHEKVLLSYSTNGGNTWSNPAVVSDPATDRGFYAAPALSPNGTDLYIVYNAITTPFRTNTTSPRSLVGVVRHADIGAGGAPTNWSTLHRGLPGDPRGSSTNNPVAEFLGDYVYGIATRTYGAALWNDARDAADCPAMDAWRAFLRGGPFAPQPAPEQDCPATFGNSDIRGGSYPDPTP